MRPLEALQTALVEVAPDLAASGRTESGRPVFDRALDSPETRRLLYRAHELAVARRGLRPRACFECYSEALDGADVGEQKVLLTVLDVWGCGHVERDTVR